MKIETLDITTMGDINVLTDERVYAVVPDHWNEGEFKMKPLRECGVGELFGKDIALIRVVK